MIRTTFEADDIGQVVEIQTEGYYFVNGMSQADVAHKRVGRLVEFDYHPFSGVLLSKKTPWVWVSFRFEGVEETYSVPVRHVTSITRFTTEESS